MSGPLTKLASKTLRSVFKQLSTPLIPDDYTHLVNPLWSKRELRGRIESAIRHTEDTVELRIQPGWGMPTNFKAGQFIGIGVQVGGRYVWRSYSLTNAPRPKDGLLNVTVKAKDQGYLSQHLVANAHAGTMVRLAAPAGEFHLPDPVPAALIFITAGSGVTPVLSMLRDIIRREQPVHIRHIHSHRGKPTALEQELIQLARECDGHQNIAKKSKTSYELKLWDTSVEKRLSAHAVLKLIPDTEALAKSGSVFACGPNELLDELEHSFPGVKTERFSLDRGHTDAQGGIVSFPGRGEIEVDGATTILEAGEKTGVQLPYGCRMGICATCVRQLDDGTARDLRTGATHVAGERIRTCVCVPAGNVTIHN